MRKFAIGTPEGTHDHLYSECLLRNRAKANLAGLFVRRGFDEIMTPSLEYYAVFAGTGTPMPEESMLKLTDRSGRLLALRPDMTTSAMRVAATRLSGERPPYRLFYLQSVFRSDVSLLGRRAEILQGGAELIGVSGKAADTQMIALAIEALSACGLSGFRLEIGHAGYFKALAAALPLDEEQFETMRRLVERKNFAALNDFLRPFSDYPAAHALKKLPQLFGGEEIFSEALSYFSDNQAADAIAYLKAIYEELYAAGLSAGIMFDLGLVNQLQYYTGIVFRAYAEGAGDAVLSGGRYDNLSAGFGRELPAVGFAIDLDEIVLCLPVPEETAPEQMVFYETGCLKEALAYMDEATPGNVYLSTAECYEGARLEMEKSGLKTLVLVGRNGISKEEVGR